MTSILPPRSTRLQKALEQVTVDLLDLPVELRKLWSPEKCPASHLPWLAWGLSVDIWDANWPEAVKRAAIADAIAVQLYRLHCRVQYFRLVDQFRTCVVQ